MNVPKKRRSTVRNRRAKASLMVKFKRKMIKTAVKCTEKMCCNGYLPLGFTHKNLEKKNEKQS